MEMPKEVERRPLRLRDLERLKSSETDRLLCTEQRAMNPQSPADHIQLCVRLLRYGSMSLGQVRRPISDPAFENANNREGGARSLAREYQDCNRGLVEDSAE